MDSPEHRHLRPPDSDEFREMPTEVQAQAWFDHATNAERQGAFSEAVSAFMQAWKLQPQHLHYYETLRGLLERHRQVDVLLQVLELGAQLFPDHLATWVSQSRWLNERGDFSAGLQAARRALALDEHCWEAMGNLGNALRGLGDYEGAASCFEAILEKLPNPAQARFNLACVLLASGDRSRGLEYYESRLELPGYERLRARNSAPHWRGESLSGKCLLVYAEQGLGDTLMMARYAPWLLQQGAKRVIVEVQKPVCWLLKQQSHLKSIEWVERQQLDSPLELDTDFQIPMLSLMRLASGGMNACRPTGAYLEWPDVQAERARELLESVPSPSLRIGIAWQGNPGAAIDRGRSLSVERLHPLLAMPGIHWFSLQSRVGLQGIEACTEACPHFHALPQLDESGLPFEESLTLMRELDLVITSDTALAHLAGALGVPCWILLQRYPEWRWGLVGDRSCWYESVRLFRQQVPGDWDCVVTAVANALQAL